MMNINEIAWRLRELSCPQEPPENDSSVKARECKTVYAMYMGSIYTYRKNPIYMSRSQYIWMNDIIFRYDVYRKHMLYVYKENGSKARDSTSIICCLNSQTYQSNSCGVRCILLLYWSYAIEARSWGSVIRIPKNFWNWSMISMHLQQNCGLIQDDSFQFFYRSFAGIGRTAVVITVRPALIW